MTPFSQRTTTDGITRGWRLRSIALGLMALVGAVAANAFSQTDADTLALISTLTNRASATNVANATNVAVNEAFRDSSEMIASTNLVGPATPGADGRLRREKYWEEQLESARRLRLARSYAEATPAFIAIITTNVPESMKRTALLELAIIAQEENEMPRAQQIFSHYLSKWPDDPNIPEVMLRQGINYRRMGLNTMALTKFYAVMTSSLTLRSEKLAHYQRLVMQAQTEIADTYFQQGKYAESAELFERLLKNNSPLLNRPQVHFKLVRSLSVLGRHDEAASQAFGFLDRHQDSPEQPEVRFYLATSLKQLGRNNDSLHQVMLLLQAQQEKAAGNPTAWAYWQQKTGNEIANQLYKEGDYLRALQLYTGLAAVSTNVDWQLPVMYQIGLTFERLEQPAKALGQYSAILRRDPEVSTNAASSLRAIVDMARWRHEYLGWQTNAERTTRTLRIAARTNSLQTAQP